MSALPCKNVVVAIRAASRARVAEALRAAVGLGLRGDSVTVIVLPAAHPATDSDDPTIRRALATLPMLGHPVLRDPSLLEMLVRDADAVEVWT